MNGKAKLLAWIAGCMFVMGMAVVVVLGIRSMHANIAAYSAQTEGRQMDPVESFRTVRQQLRSMQKAQLNDIAHDSSTDAELAAMAQKQLLDLCTREEQELTLEGILSMRGWEQPVVTVHPDSVNVLLQAETIARQESSVILDLVCRETGIMSGNVKIIPIN